MAELSKSHIDLMDIDPDRSAVTKRMAHKVAEALGTRPKITAHRTRKAALDGAYCARLCFCRR